MKISIVITTYNYANYIGTCLNSCLAQTGTNLEYEVIVIDDGSTDNTQELLSNLSDPKVRLYTLNNGGIEVASNHGLKVANGDFIVRVDADDTLNSNYLETIEPHLDDNVGFYYSDYEIINELGESTGIVELPSFTEEEVLSRGDFLATGTIYPTAVLRDIGGYNTTTKNCGLENYELILKLIKMSFVGKHIPKTLFQYRRHGENISIKRKNEIIEYGRQLFASNELGPYRTNKNHPYKLILDN